jgi:predicted SAM-dependent methyltransferase
MICNICQNEKDNELITAYEKMLGIGDKFNYLMCSYCGCLQLINKPDDMYKYYPDSYYSFDGNLLETKFGIKYYLRKKRLQHLLDKNNLIGYVTHKITGDIKFASWLMNVNCKSYYKILDVGCGKGHRLNEFRLQGFTNLFGIDNHVEKDVFCENGIKIFKKELLDENNKYDFIMLHHTFEHIEEQERTLRKAFELLNNERYLLIRIPIVAFAYRKYGNNWVQLDAPRHFYLHTIKSMRIVSEKCGFKITKIVFDSNEFQFWGSEQYINNISLFDKKSYAVNPSKSMFSKEQINEFAQKAKELNENEDGDMACFYLYKN